MLNQLLPNLTNCILEEEKTTCFAATNCDRPLEELVADMLMTLVGPDKQMEDEDEGIFEGTMFDYIAEVAEELGIGLGGVGVTGQNNIGRRELEYRYSSRELRGWHGNIVINNITQRMLPGGSSALDVSMVVTGDYRPPPFLDLDVIAEDSINRQGAKVVNTLRERGERAGRDFFSRVEGIEAVAASDLTARPTRTPTGKPTPAPTGPPVSDVCYDGDPSYISVGICGSFLSRDLIICRYLLSHQYIHIIFDLLYHQTDCYSKF